MTVPVPLPQTPMPAPADPGDGRHDAILDAAFRAFATYGYRRTTMDDIARGAGVSRTALYLHFRNKDDIFRSLADRHFDQTVAAMGDELANPAVPAVEALVRAFAAKDGKFMDVVLGSPHGRELLEAGFAVSADAAERGEAQIADLLRAFFGRFDVDPALGGASGLTELVKAALKGLKLQATSLPDYVAGQAALAHLVAAALKPRPD